MVEINKIVEKAIDEVLAQMKQPYKSEFTAFIVHVLMDQYTDDEIIERIDAIKLRNEGSSK